jgi:hypothetical protein
MNILSIDAATKTGWATNILGRRSGITEFALKRGESPGMRFLRCRAWLNEMWKLLGGQIDVICYEQAHHRGGTATACCVGFGTDRILIALLFESGLFLGVPAPPFLSVYTDIIAGGQPVTEELKNYGLCHNCRKNKNVRPAVHREA